MEYSLDVILQNTSIWTPDKTAQETPTKVSNQTFKSLIKYLVIINGIVYSSLLLFFFGSK